MREKKILKLNIYIELLERDQKIKIQLLIDSGKDYMRNV